MPTVIALALLLLLIPFALVAATAIALGLLWWRAEEEAITRVFDSSIDHTRK